MLDQENNNANEVLKIAVQKLQTLKSRLTKENYSYLLFQSAIEISQDMGIEITDNYSETIKQLIEVTK